MFYKNNIIKDSLGFLWTNWRNVYGHCSELSLMLKLILMVIVGGIVVVKLSKLRNATRPGMITEI